MHLNAPPTGAAATRVAGIELMMLPQRAAWLPAAGVLLVADAHFGKAAAFRRAGLPVPGGTTRAALATLDQALHATGAGQVVFLGDLLHSRAARAPATLQAVGDWRRARAGLRLTLVRGNHDLHAGDPPPAWDVRCVDEPLRLPGLEPLLLCHHPQPRDGGYVLAGHSHPGVVLGSRATGRLRLPCFHLGAGVGVLPAFGDFTGLHRAVPAPGDRVWVVVDGAVQPLAPR